ncbi:MarR family transcriptional regulator [Pseudolabrys taiwanensis]|uniref:MarR family transcriptional regulator n=1 Tax=Pseudolabrys taiwanensis TaxID=331696 RepID=A0A345ZUT5_9HYPH|nr:MarR family transcriptional regulator [Pseudolabrys taiwanensis]
MAPDDMVPYQYRTEPVKVDEDRLKKAVREEVPEIGIGKRLRLAHMAFARGMRVELAEAGLTFGQFVHLERLWNEDGLTQVELSRRVGVEMASSTSVLAELEKLGWIRRERGEADRRKIFVYLTRQGRELATPVLARVKEVNRTARRGIAAGDIAAVFRILDAIAANMNDKYPGGSARLDRD